MAVTASLVLDPNPISPTGSIAYKTIAAFTFSGIDSYYGKDLTVKIVDDSDNLLYSSVFHDVQSDITGSTSIRANDIGFAINSNTVYIYVQLWDGDTPVKSAYDVLALNTPPEISDISFENNVPSLNTFIENITPITIKANIKPLFGSGLSSATATVTFPNATTQTITLSHVSGYQYSGTVNASYGGNLVIQISATDTRGQVSSRTLGLAVEYHLPPIGDFSIFRCDQYGDRDLGGEYLSITAYGQAIPDALSIADAGILVKDQNNNIIIDNGNGNPLSINNKQTYVLGNGNINPSLSYSIEYYFTDNANTYGGEALTSIGTTTIPSVVRVINVKDGGTGIAFGKLAAQNSLTDSAWDINTDGEYLVQGDPLVDHLPDASSTQRGLVNTSTQTIAGAKTFLGTPKIASNNAGGAIQFCSLTDPTTSAGSTQLWMTQNNAVSGGAAYNVYRPDRFYFVLKSFDSSTGAIIDGGSDQYRLPTATPDKTSASYYNILTTKDPVTIAQGGTGATTADAALAALSGARLVNLGAVSGTNSVVIHIPNSSRHVLMLTAIVSGYHAMYMCTTSAAGSMYGQQIAQGSGYTRTTSANTVTFAKGASANVTVFDLVLTGDAASLVV